MSNEKRNVPRTIEVETDKGFSYTEPVSMSGSWWMVIRSMGYITYIPDKDKKQKRYIVTFARLHSDNAIDAFEEIKAQH